MKSLRVTKSNSSSLNLKKDFPIFKNNRNLVYLDSAATTQKPKRVINKLTEFYSNYNSNVHRGLYRLSEIATEEYEKARVIVAKFINADPEEIIFVSNATDGLNSIAEMLRYSNLLSKKPRIVLSELEHHSNILPWQRFTSEKIEYLMLNSDFLLGSRINEEADILSLAHASNVTGTILPVEEIWKNAENVRFKVLDASQSIAHMKIDVKKLDVDFMVFSGHKAYAPTGVGVIYAKKEILNDLEPFRVGGGMIKEVNRKDSTWADLPEKFEAGTPPIADAIALGEALNFLSELTFERIENHEQELRATLYNELKKIPRVKIYHPALRNCALGIISFSVNNIHAHDIAQFLGDQNICVRAGHHCTQILHREVLNIPASVRVSLAVYNTDNDIERLIDGLKSAIKYYS